MNDYYLKIKGLFKSLKFARKQVSNDEFVLFPIEEVGPEYDSVVVNITLRAEELPL